MKFLPWALLALVLAYPLFAQGTLTKLSTLNGPVKILGQPAASEWIDLESGQDGQAGVPFTVPTGRVLTLVYKLLRPDGGGDVIGSVDIDGQVVFLVSLSAGEFQSVHVSGAQWAWVLGETAASGQVVTVTRASGGTAPAATTYFVRGWLEDIR